MRRRIGWMKRAVVAAAAVVVGHLLKEDGYNLLQEDGTKILL